MHKRILTDLGTFLHKAIPDTELTVQKYADAKFEYLVRFPQFHRGLKGSSKQCDGFFFQSYCLKVKEMDDEELTFNQLQESLYRVETGNYEYRLVLRCRQLARVKFSKLRADVSVKLDLLDQKHVQDILCQLQRLIAAICRYNDEAATEIRELVGLFPVEMDLKEDVFQYKQNPFQRFNSEERDDHDDDGEPVARVPKNWSSRPRADDTDQNIIDLN
ncbi:hypothetical protein RvY_18482 [Ramazzottius varieornatus]|uniref:AH domain-containing protein n=1 Tax=Ramazzottius varieornatus TaxID=947166 RepID=A0A1D1W5Y4_RAMVA|nr:hypothetical protein RvY_18482 [Ramazzottius varieornatus]